MKRMVTIWTFLGAVSLLLMLCASGCGMESGPFDSSAAGASARLGGGSIPDGEPIPDNLGGGSIPDGEPIDCVTAPVSARLAGGSIPDGEPIPDNLGGGSIPDGEPIPDNLGGGSIPDGEPID